jgi:hypothetical protein
MAKKIAQNKAAELEAAAALSVAASDQPGQVDVPLQQSINSIDSGVEIGLPQQVGEDKLGKTLDRLKSFKASANWIRSNLFSAKVLAGSGAKPSMRKISNLSHKRAAASCPALHIAMIEKFIEDDKLMLEEGWFESGTYTAADVFNMDEIGLDPSGRPMKTYSLHRANQRRFRSKSGEKAPLHTTLVLCVSASGEMLTPVVILRRD